MAKPQEISVNMPVKSIVDAEWLDHKAATANVVVGDKYATLILSPYGQMYRQALRKLMRGIVLSEAAEATDDAGHTVIASIFGFVEKYPIEYMQGEATAFIPAIGRRFAPMVPDPSAAIHNYHRRLLIDTNVCLDALGANYRLAPLEDMG